MPGSRKKLIHTVGSIAQVEFIAASDSPYTGLFKGSKNALIRLSTAKGFDADKEPLENFTPGISLKLLKDGKPSVNCMAMYGVNGVPTWNPFTYDASNHIPAASGVALTLVA
jgi:hypothetical protein